MFDKGSLDKNGWGGGARGVLLFESKPRHLPESQGTLGTERHFLLAFLPPSSPCSWSPPGTLGTVGDRTTLPPPGEPTPGWLRQWCELAS